MWPRLATSRLRSSSLPAASQGVVVLRFFRSGPQRASDYEQPEGVSPETREMMRADPARRPPHSHVFIRNVPHGVAYVRLGELLKQFEGIEDLNMSNTWIKKSKGRTHAHIRFFSQFLACDAVRNGMLSEIHWKGQGMPLSLRPQLESRLPASSLIVEAPYMDNEAFEDALNSLNLPGIQSLDITYKGVGNVEFEDRESAKVSARKIYEACRDANTKFPPETLAYYPWRHAETEEEVKEKSDKEYIREVNRTEYDGVGKPSFYPHGESYITVRRYG